MAIEAPKIMEGSWTEGLRLAESAREPVFLPVKPHVDDRGWSVMNLMTGVLGPQGQINYSVQHPQVVKAWHRHRRQADFWMCLHGHLKAGVHRDADNRSWAMVMGEMRPGVLVIPPTLWHGAATIGVVPAGLLYYVTTAYDAASPDEDRRPFDSITGFRWDIEHR